MSLSGGSNVVNQALVAAVGEEKMAEGHLLGPLSMQQSSHHLAGVSSLGLESPESPLDKSKEDKIKRRKVTKACLYCQKSHMSCDRERPCKRCVQRNIQHLCRDMDGKRRGRKGGYLSGEVPNAKPLVPDTQGETFSFPQPALDLVFASLEEISPMLYQYERTRAIEEEKNDPGRHLDELAKQVDDPAKQVMSAFWNWLHHRLPAQMHNDVAVTRADLENIKRKILLSRPVQDAELESCKHEMTLQLKQWRATFHPLEIPVVMWGRNFQVLDYNKTFSDICGGHLPDNELSMLRLLSVTSIVNLLRAVTHLLKTPTCDMTNFTCSWQVQLPSGLNYLEGVCWLVVRRDPLQIPLIFMGVFTPANPMSGLPSLRDPK